tara:strand:+ start:8461 stop:9426 length:966 start_codon:yes stop_codon:yes gene_type:complete
MFNRYQYLFYDERGNMKNYSKLHLTGFNDKKFMISGCNGYLGSELVKQLEANLIHYVGIDKNSTNKNSGHIFNLTENKEVDKIITKNNPDYFIHTATHSAIAYKNNFLESFLEDTISLVNILSILKKENSKAKLVYFSSSYVYSSNSKNTELVNEESAINPAHNFGIAKAFFEQMIMREYKNSIIFRLSSVFGKGNSLHPNAIKGMAEQAIKSDLISIWGSGKRRMQYVYLEDVIKSTFASLEISGGIYNLSSNGYVTVRETADKIAKFFNTDIELLENKIEGETLPPLDNSKLVKSLNSDLISNFDKTLDFYLNDIKANI